MFVRFKLVWFCLFPLPLDVWEVLRLVIVAIPGLFSFFQIAIQPFVFLHPGGFDFIHCTNDDPCADRADSEVRVIFCVSKTGVLPPQ